MNIIFLDIDGVLNNGATNEMSPEGFVGIDNNLLELLVTLKELTNAVVVLTSTWKDEWDIDASKRKLDGKYMNNKLSDVGISIIDKVKDYEDGSYFRGQSILLYLREHPDVEHFVILDDEEFDINSIPELRHHFIQTNEDYGFTAENLKDAVRIMSW